MPDTETDLRARVVGLEHNVQSNSQRLTTLETWQRQREIDGARNNEKWVAMEVRIDTRFCTLNDANDEQLVRSSRSCGTRAKW